MSIFTPEILAMAEDIKRNTAEWGVDDDGAAYAEFDGKRETVPVSPSSGWAQKVETNAACSIAHARLEARLSCKIEYHFYGRSHPYGR